MKIQLLRFYESGFIISIDHLLWNLQMGTYLPV